MRDAGKEISEHLNNSSKVHPVGTGGALGGYIVVKTYQMDEEKNTVEAWNDKIKPVLSPDMKESQEWAKKQGDRFNEGKLKWSLVDFDALEDTVRVLEFGARKYSSHNWKKGLKVTEILESMQRHINGMLRGEDNDPESGLPHYGHLGCNVMFLGYMLKYKPEMDDRFIDENKKVKEEDLAGKRD